MVVIKKKVIGKDPNKAEQEWDNPSNPEKAGDQRDFEQLKRQAREAERRKQNLTDPAEEQDNPKKD